MDYFNRLDIVQGFRLCCAVTPREGEGVGFQDLVFRAATSPTLQCCHEFCLRFRPEHLFGYHFLGTSGVGGEEPVDFKYLTIQLCERSDKMDIVDRFCH